MKSLPADVAPYKRTPVFSESSVPAGLRREHKTQKGVWGRISILSGSLTYRILEPEREEHLLTVDHPGIIEPGILHEVEPQGEVEFFVEFLRQRASEGA